MIAGDAGSGMAVAEGQGRPAHRGERARVAEQLASTSRDDPLAVGADEARRCPRRCLRAARSCRAAPAAARRAPALLPGSRRNRSGPGRRRASGAAARRWPHGSSKRDTRAAPPSRLPHARGDEGIGMKDEVDLAAPSLASSASAAAIDARPSRQLSRRWQVTRMRRAAAVAQRRRRQARSASRATHRYRVLPVTWISPGTCSARRFAAASSVGANSRSASASIAVRYSSSGQGSSGSWVRRPASTWATGTPAVKAASAAPSALDVSPWTTSRSGALAQAAAAARAVTVATWRCGSSSPGQPRFDRAESRRARSRSGRARDAAR